MKSESLVIADQNVAVNTFHPTIPAQKKERVIDKVFPQEMRNFLKVACKYERMDLIPEIFAAYDRYCDEQDRILSAVLTCVELPSDEQLKNMEAFLCKKYEASKARIEIQTDSTLLGGFVLRRGRQHDIAEQLTPKSFVCVSDGVENGGGHGKSCRHGNQQ